MEKRVWVQYLDAFFKFRPGSVPLYGAQIKSGSRFRSKNFTPNGRNTQCNNCTIYIFSDVYNYIKYIEKVYKCVN